MAKKIKKQKKESRKVRMLKAQAMKRLKKGKSLTAEMKKYIGERKKK